MTSNLSPYTAQLAHVVDVNDDRIVGADAGESGFGPRRIEDDTDAGSPRTRAGLLVGLLLCASSSALMIWLATLLV